MNMKMGVFVACLPWLFLGCDTTSMDDDVETSVLTLTAPAGSTGWVARHGLTSAAYQTEFNKWSGLGYRLTQINGYSVGTEARYAAIWDKVPAGVAWVARHGLTSAQYQSEFNTLTSQGYRPVQVSGYGVSGVAYYAAIFDKSTPGAWAAGHDMTAAQYQAFVDKWTPLGYRPQSMSAFTVNGQDRYAAVWVQTSGPAWVARHAMTSSGYQAEFDKWTAQGYQLTQISGYSISSAERYAAVWEKATDAPPWAAAHGMTAAAYVTNFEDFRLQGYRPMRVSGFDVGGTTKYAAMWVNTAISGTNLTKIDSIVSKYMAVQPTVGLSFAITQNDRLVFAKGYGKADKTTGSSVHSNHLFRIASLSKAVTSAAIMRLVQDGKLSLDDKVFGTGAVLGTAYGTKAYTTRLKNITVRHLLNHTAGGWTNDANDPMFKQPTYSQSALITWVLDNVAQTSDPGKTFGYSNFGYCLLGRIIEAKSGQSYANYVKSKFLVPAGATAMTIGGKTAAQRLTNEVAYYGTNPYEMDVPRMDSHGGWVASPIDMLRFIVRVDNLGSAADYLTSANITTMTTGSVANANYAFGWSVNAAGNWWHNGMLPGTWTQMARLSNGINYVAMTNSTGTNNPDLDAMMWELVNGVTAWPTYDLFVSQ